MLDTNVFIEGHERSYRSSIVPGFWEWLKLACAADVACSITKVREEITSVSLVAAIEGFPTTMFREFETEDIRNLITIDRWIRDSRQYLEEAKREFRDGADPRLVAYAKSRGLTVVTSEVRSPESRRRIKIPDVCDRFAVEVVDICDMLQSEGAKFVLDEAVRKRLLATGRTV